MNNWMEILKFIAAATAGELLIFAWIWYKTEPWQPHEVKPIRSEDDSLDG